MIEPPAHATTDGPMDAATLAAEGPSSALFQSVVERVPDVAIFTLDPSGVIQSWNVGAARLTGYRRSKILGQHISVLYPGVPDGRAGPAQEWISGPREHRFEEVVWVTRKDGTRFWADVTFSDIRGDDGEVVGYAVIARDHTYRKEAVVAQRRLTAILEGTTDFVSFADTEGRILYINPAGRAMLGIGADEDVTNLTILDVHPAWSTGLLLREAFPAVSKHGSWSGEAALKTREGRAIPVHQVLVSHRDQGSEIDFVSTVARDITERKRTEERQELIIEASRRLAGSLDYQTTLQNLVESVVPGIANWCVIAALEEQEDEIQWVAAWHREASKREPLKEIIGLHQPLDREVPVGLHRALVSEEPELVAQVTDPWLRAAVQSDETLEIVRELGAHSAIFVPLVARGRTLGGIGFFYADTERSYGEADLEFVQELAGRAALFVDNARLYQAQQEAVRIRDEVVSIVAHDLRNPLGRILMGADFLLEISAANETERRQLEIIRRAAQGMNRLIQDLLEVSRMEAGGGLVIQRERQALAPLIKHACEMIRPDAEQKGLTLRCSSLPDLEVNVDRDRFLQVMSNLLGNAVKFTNEGEIGVTVVAEGDEVRVSVRDTGMGIAEEDRAHLFEQFWQASQTGRGGAGLGLAITEGIVEAHGGRV